MVKLLKQVQWAFSGSLGKSKDILILDFSTTHVTEQGFNQVRLLHMRKNNAIVLAWATPAEMAYDEAD